MPIPTNTRLDRYTIRTLLGVGGMGEVYLAHDSVLRRPVAIKLLPQAHTCDRERLRRFEREAQATSSLNHPHILTIHEFCEFEGRRFIVSEYVEGESLRQRMARAGLELHEALDVAVQVASALTAAHRAGVIHRDIKPENVMLRHDGFVKVLDFGLAKLTVDEVAGLFAPSDRDAPTCTLDATSPGTLIGTVAYMSPERVRGADAGPRGDIWSLGVVLYEMVAGRRPFEGETPSDVIAAVLREDPPPLTQTARVQPTESEEAAGLLEEIIAKALAKDCAARYQSSDDLLAELKALKSTLESAARSALDLRRSRGETAANSGGPAAALPATPAQLPVAESREPRRRAAWRMFVGGARSKAPAATLVSALALAAVALFVYYQYARAGTITSIAVLPFTNASEDQSIDYLSEGLSENIIDDLSQLPRLKVIARGSSFRYGGKDVDPLEVGRSLGVQALVLGRIVRRGDELQLRVELVDAREKTQMWSGQYTCSGKEAQSVQAEVSRAVSSELRMRLTGEDEKRIAGRFTNDDEAYQLYLKGRYYWNKLTRDDLEKSLDYFNKAVEKDPKYALAYSGLANSYLTLGANYLPAEETYPKASYFAHKALELNDGLAEAHYAAATTKYFYEHDLAGAEKELDRTLELNPNYAAAYSMLSHLRLTKGQTAEAIPLIKRALDRDPLSLLFNTNLGYVYYYARQYNNALTQMMRTLELEPDAAFLYSDMCSVYAQMGRHEEALASCQKAIIMQGNEPGTLSSLGVAYALAGRRQESDWVIKTLSQPDKGRYIQPYHLAAIYAAQGRNDEAFKWLERANRENSSMLSKIKVDPSLDKIRSDPRFNDLLKRLNLL
jgi:serine/threonine protein kinase/Flp pilus assembly protein TadD